ncbi:MAG: hypothetical protein ACRELB_04515, partial [Polyangiaceae bacterium]
MRRGKAFTVFGWLCTVIAVGTISARSQAAGKAQNDAAPAPAAHTAKLGLLPLVANREVPLFGSFIKPGGSPGALPSGAACAPDMVEV